MKKNEKRLIIVLLVITVIVVAIYMSRKDNGEIIENDVNVEVIEEENKVVEEFVQVLEDGTKLNTSTKLSETKDLNGLQIGNIQLTESNGQSLLLADVVNNTEAATDVTIVDITLLDKEGNEIVTLGGIIGPLQPGETTQLNTSSTLDYANAYDFTVKVTE